jgi:hypothetical protein
MKVNPNNPGAEKNLRRFGKELDPVEMGRKGGRVKSEAKSNEAKLRSWKAKLKRQALTDKDMAWLLERVENSKASAIDMMSYLEKLEIECDDCDIKTKSIIMSLKKEVFKAIHGSKINIQGVHVHMSKKEYEESVKNMKSRVVDILGEEVDE